MSDREAILFANDAFYAAFAGRDAAAMDQAWAPGEVTCIHPGWAPLRGREAVMKSWREILANKESPAVSARRADVLQQGSVAIVTCVEIIPAGARMHTLAATNIFVKDGTRWKMVHHQAGEAAVDP